MWLAKMTNLRRSILISTIFANTQSVLLLTVSKCRWLYGPLGNGGMMGDVVKYFVYADRIVKGLTPYSDYPVEYPILAFLSSSYLV